MNFENMKLVYVFSCVALCLIIVSPTLMTLFSYAETYGADEAFSELWILGSNNVTDDYPFSVSEDDVYRINVGAGNYLGEMAYYAIYVKFRNQVDPSPNKTSGLPSSLKPIFEYRVFLRDNQTWNKEVSFSFKQVEFDGNVSRVSLLFIDEHSVVVDKIGVWDAENKGFYYQLFFEMWVYNPLLSDFEFHNRSVGIWLNMSGPS